MSDVVFASCDVGLDAWSPMGFTLDGCVVDDVGAAGDRSFAELAEGCVEGEPGFGDLSTPAGPDGWFFTDDDPWRSDVGGARP